MSAIIHYSNCKWNSLQIPNITIYSNNFLFVATIFHKHFRYVVKIWNSGAQRKHFYWKICSNILLSWAAGTWNNTCSTKCYGLGMLSKRRALMKAILRATWRLLIYFSYSIGYVYLNTIYEHQAEKGIH